MMTASTAPRGDKRGQHSFTAQSDLGDLILFDVTPYPGLASKNRRVSASDGVKTFESSVVDLRIVLFSTPGLSDFGSL